MNKKSHLIHKATKSREHKSLFFTKVRKKFIIENFIENKRLLRNRKI